MFQLVNTPFNKPEFVQLFPEVPVPAYHPEQLLVPIQWVNQGYIF